MVLHHKNFNNFLSYYAIIFGNWARDLNVILHKTIKKKMNNHKIYHTESQFNTHIHINLNVYAFKRISGPPKTSYDQLVLIYHMYIYYIYMLKKLSKTL